LATNDGAPTAFLQGTISARRVNTGETGAEPILEEAGEAVTEAAKATAINAASGEKRGI
jgi:hypothetical protein